MLETRAKVIKAHCAKASVEQLIKKLEDSIKSERASYLRQCWNHHVIKELDSRKVEARFIARSAINSFLILCTDNEFHSERQVGVAGFSAKLFKTFGGAQSARNRFNTVELHVIRRDKKQSQSV